MNGDALHTIGDLARRTGLTVKAIRFYSDSGIVPPTDRGPAGHRRYDTDAVARLDLVRTLRDLGLDLPTIRRVVDRELSLPEVAAAHAEALAAQIHTLRLRRAVLTVAARREAGPEEMDLLHTLAKLSEDERRHLIADFLTSTFGDPDADPAFAGIIRSMTPELPDHPEPEQVEAWVELAELTRDPDFRTALRRLAEQHCTERTRSGATVPRRDTIAVARTHAAAALAAGIPPTAPEAAPIVAALTADCARTTGLPDDAHLRRRLLTRLRSANDPRRHRYLHLLALINGWPAPIDPAPELAWSIHALRAGTPT
ncbi:MerR family transcriptional regulator [Embleya sp. NBC_00888]|uniref:MerR family transcriptional regulator n=1 Tax=Embleya sp. NBC_00888 TaxID=2975960 RepID=UPI00386E20A1|nr:MerR family transcriptional regulator [Embleya sp. NBC_00888]